MKSKCVKILLCKTINLENFLNKYILGSNFLFFSKVKEKKSSLIKI